MKEAMIETERRREGTVMASQKQKTNEAMLPLFVLLALLQINSAIFCQASLQTYRTSALINRAAAAAPNIILKL